VVISAVDWDSRRHRAYLLLAEASGLSAASFAKSLLSLKS
jgi:hypothetical protein